MALGAKRKEVQDTIDFALNEVAERGLICSILPGTTAAGEVSATVNPTGVGAQPIGVLMTDVESFNYDREYEATQRLADDVGSVVGLLQIGQVLTDQITTGETPRAGDAAYLGTGGQFSTTQLDDGLGNTAARVGKFLSAKDARGFALVSVNIQ